MIGTITHKETTQHPCVYQDEDFSLYIEDSPIGWILHCYVSKWGKRVYNKMLDTMAILAENAPRKELYAISNNNKLTKFASMFGMESIDTVTDKEGKELGELLQYA